MSRKTGIGYISTVLWISAAVLFTSAAQAMEIRQFDKMVKDDQTEYVAPWFGVAGDAASSSATPGSARRWASWEA